MSISIGDAILFLSADDTKLKKTLKSSEAAYEQYEKATGRAISNTTKMQAGDWFMLDASGKKFGSTIKSVGDSMKTTGGQAVSMSQAFEWVGGSLGRYSKMLAMGGTIGTTIALGHAIATAAAENEKLTSSLGRLADRIMDPVNSALDTAIDKVGDLTRTLDDLASRGDYKAQEREAARKEAEAKKRNKEAKDEQALNRAGTNLKRLSYEDPLVTEAKKQGLLDMKAMQGMGILGGMGGATYEEQKAINQFNQYQQREAWRAQRLGKRNIAFEQEIARRKAGLQSGIDRRNAGIREAWESIEKESGGDPNKARELLAGFTDWYGDMTKKGSRQVGTAAQVINQYITISHANVAMGEKQKAAYNMRRSMMPGVP